jgi:hypothetical protein
MKKLHKGISELPIVKKLNLLTPINYNGFEVLRKRLLNAISEELRMRKTIKALSFKSHLLCEANKKVIRHLTLFKPAIEFLLSKQIDVELEEAEYAWRAYPTYNGGEFEILPVEVAIKQTIPFAIVFSYERKDYAIIINRFKSPAKR